MDHTHVAVAPESWRSAHQKPPVRHRGTALEIGPGVGAPGATAGWVEVAIPEPRLEEATEPIAVSLAWGRLRRSWTIDPVLVGVAGAASALIGLGLLKGMLVAFLMWLL